MINKNWGIMFDNKRFFIFKLNKNILII